MLRLRIGLAAAAGILVSAGALGACGSSSAGNASGYSPSDAGGNPDAGEDVSPPIDAGPDTLPPDSPSGDASGDANGLPPPGVLFVHASPSLPDLRFCWGIGSAGPSATDRPYPFATPMPASNYPGVPVGGATPLADASSMEGSTLAVWAYDARAVANAERGLDCNTTNQCSCAALKTSGAVDATAIHQMPAIQGGVIVPGATVVLWVRGCLGIADDPLASVQRCGADWTPNGAGNLRMDAVSVPGAFVPPPDGGVFAVQAAQLSPALAVLAGDAGAVVSFGAQGGADASVVTTLSTPDQITPIAAQQVATSIPLASYGQLGFAVDVAGVGDAGGGAHLWMSLAQSLDLVDPTQDPSQYFAQPTSYLVTVIGDPAGAPPGGNPDAAYDGTGLHLLVLPLP